MSHQFVNPTANQELEYVGTCGDHLVHTLKELLNKNKDDELKPYIRDCLTFSEGVANYAEKHTTPSQSIQEKIYKATIAENWVARHAEGQVSFVPLDIMIDAYQATFLNILTQMCKAKLVLEIGVFTGYSAVSFALAPTVTEMICLEIEPYFVEFFRKQIQGTELEPKIELILGPALESLKLLHGKTFDIVFIDGDKNNYINYYKYIMDTGLLSPGGSFIIDNTIWSGDVLPEKRKGLGVAIHNFNEFIRADSRVNVILLPIRDGITLITSKN